MLEDIIKKYGGEEVTAMQLYTDVFRLGQGYIQKEGEPAGSYKANPVGYYRNKEEEKGHFRILFEDTFEKTLKELQEATDFCIMNGLTYFGRKNVQEHASKMFAMIFDLDGLTDDTLTNFFTGCRGGAYPTPNYVSLSGHGVHLYYIFEKPLELYPYTKIQLKELKFALTSKIWNMYTSTEKPQHQGINQGFRAIGSKTKIDGVKVRAFKISEEPATVQQLCSYVAAAVKIDEKKLFRESKTTLQQAKEKYPEWYEKVILNKDKSRTRWRIEEKVNGGNPYALYDWWKRQIHTGTTYGHRYFAIMCLAIYGVKCGKSYEEVEADAMQLIPYMNTINEKEPFTVNDCKVALECYDKRYCTFPIKDIEKISGIRIDKNKRNGRKQKTHLRIARQTLEILNEEANKNLQGRKSKQNQVKQYRAENPAATPKQCIEATGLNKNTVYKWWNS